MREFFINSEFEVVETFRGDASLKLLTEFQRDPRTGLIRQVQMPSVPETVQGYAGQIPGAIHTVGRDRVGRAISYTTSDGTATVSHIEHTIDQLGRISKTKRTIFGAPAGSMLDPRIRVTAGAFLILMRESVVVWRV